VSYSVVFDIASASIGGALIELREEKGKKLFPKILTSKRLKVKSEIMIPEVMESLTKSLNLFSVQYQKPSRVLCVFSSPWYISQTKAIKIQRKTSFEINKELIEKLLGDEAKLFKKEWQDEEKQHGDYCLEKEMLKIFLNGYEVENPEGRRAKNLELHTYLSLVPEAIKGQVEKIILNTFSFSDIHFHSFPFVLFAILEKVLNFKDDAIFIDMTGKITDVFIVRDGIIEEASSFPKGENHFVKKIADSLGVEFEEADSLFKQYSRGELDQEFSKKTEGALKIAASAWAKDLVELFGEQTRESCLPRESRLPQNLYFVGLSVSLKQIIEQLQGRGFNCHFFRPDFLKHFNTGKDLDKNKDIFLLLESLFDAFYY